MSHFFVTFLRYLPTLVPFCPIVRYIPKIGRSTLANIPTPLDIFNHGLRTPRESFFSKIRNFWAWADKLGRKFMRHLGYFWPNYKHYFGTVSPLSMGKCSWSSFLQKTLVFRSKTYNSQILPK
jgi:hypothetical protein